MIVADAMHCQKETAKVIIKRKADYLLNVKDNQQTLKEDIVDYVQDETLRKEMNHVSIKETNRERVEIRTAYTTADISWLENRSDWMELRSIGAIHTEVKTAKGKN